MILKGGIYKDGHWKWTFSNTSTYSTWDRMQLYIKSTEDLFCYLPFRNRTQRQFLFNRHNAEHFSLLVTWKTVASFDVTKLLPKWAKQASVPRSASHVIWARSHIQWAKAKAISCNIQTSLKAIIFLGGSLLEYSTAHSETANYWRILCINPVSKIFFNLK